MLHKLDQGALLKILKLNVEVVLPERELTLQYEHMYSLNGTNITLTGNNLNDVILVRGFHINDYPLSEDGLASAIADIGNVLEEFNQSIS